MGQVLLIAAGQDVFALCLVVSATTDETISTGDQPFAGHGLSPGEWMINNQQRQAYLIAALCPDDKDVPGLDEAVSRSYVYEKIRYAFSAKDESDLLGRLDVQRRSVYSRLLKEAYNGK